MLPGQLSLQSCGPDERGLIGRRLRAPLKAKKEQRPCDFGLFSDESTQVDLVDLTRRTQATMKFSVKCQPQSRGEFRYGLVAYPSGRADFPTESRETWATREEAETVRDRANAGDLTGLTLASYADD